ncbi:MAG: SPOR domain-containing protein, partial [Duodenibacillus sp.]
QPKEVASSNKTAAPEKSAVPAVKPAVPAANLSAASTAQTKAPAKTTPSAKSVAPQKPASADKPQTRPLRAYAHGRYFIQVVATRNKEAATKKAQSLHTLGLPAYTEIVHRRGSDLWRVRVGKFLTQDDARRALDILALNSIENGGIHQEKPKPEAGRTDAAAP